MPLLQRNTPTMKKIALSILVIFSVVLFQSCKKSDVAAATTTTPPILQATINDATWTPDTTAASITYNAATKTKVFTLTGTKSQKQVSFSLTLPNATNSADFTANTYRVDNTNNLTMVYSTQQKNSSGSYVFVPFGNVEPAGGVVVITSVDTVNKTITGSFALTTKVTNYDSNGNVVSVTAVVVSAGSFTNMPYTFTSN